jgi:hypothetical protein
LLAVYTIILYAYGAKIVSTWVWPKGNVVYMMIAYIVVGVLCLWFMGPATLQSAGRQWIKKVSTGFYAFLLPLMSLYFVAIGMHTLSRR